MGQRERIKKGGRARIPITSRGNRKEGIGGNKEKKVSYLRKKLFPITKREKKQKKVLHLLLILFSCGIQERFWGTEGKKKKKGGGKPLPTIFLATAGGERKKPGRRSQRRRKGKEEMPHRILLFSIHYATAEENT